MKPYPPEPRGKAEADLKSDPPQVKLVTSP